jgi:hypothetical protein
MKNEFKSIKWKKQQPFQILEGLHNMDQELHFLSASYNKSTLALPILNNSPTIKNNSIASITTIIIIFKTSKLKYINLGNGLQPYKI